MAEIALEALLNIHDKLVDALVNYVDVIENKLNERKLLPQHQVANLCQQKNSKIKIQYILRDCIQFQLKSDGIDTQFQVLTEFMKSTSSTDQNLLPLVEYIEEKSVPINPSQQVTDDNMPSPQVTDDGESGLSGFGKACTLHDTLHQTYVALMYSVACIYKYTGIFS